MPVGLLLSGQSQPLVNAGAAREAGICPGVRSDTLSRYKQHDSLRFRREPLPHRPHALGRLKLNRNLRDIQTHCASERFANRQPVILQLRTLQNHGRIDMGNGKSLHRGQIANMLEELKAVGALPSRIGIRKMHPDIPLRDRPQNGVRNRMREDVGIRMAVEAERMRYFHAAEHELSALDEPMDIVTYSHPVHTSRFTP